MSYRSWPSVSAPKITLAEILAPTRQFCPYVFSLLLITNRNVGAMAELFDISCMGNTALFDAVPDMAIAAWNATTSNISDVVSLFNMINNTEVLGKEFRWSSFELTKSHSKIIGQHYFVPTPNGMGLSAKWDFTSSEQNSNAFVIAAKVNQSDAPTGSQDIDWVSLKSVGTGRSRHR
jgi:hypothetical protein